MVPKYKGTRFEQLGYIGQNFYPAGVRLGRAAGALAAEKYGKGCHFLFTTINPGESGLEIRMSGQAEGLKEYGHTYETIKTSNEPSEAISITESYLRGHSEIKGVLDSAEGVYYNAVALKEMGHAPGEIVNGGWNLNPEILGEVKSGYIFATIDQTPFYQGFFTVLELWANRNLGIIPFDIDTGSGWVDATNVDAVLKMSEAGWR
jgi:simple sugar transport system substrate-binding protein